MTNFRWPWHGDSPATLQMKLQNLAIQARQSHVIDDATYRLILHKVRTEENEERLKEGFTLLENYINSKVEHITGEPRVEGDL